MEQKSAQELINSMEELLVKQFRALQSLVTLTKDERQALTDGKTDQIVRLVEEKEVVLDQMGLIEDSRRMLTDQLAARMGIQRQSFLLSDLFSKMDRETAQRLTRLNDGICSLVGQARDLNDWNKAYAATTLEWLDAAQAYLLKFFEPNQGYYPPGSNTSLGAPVTMDVDHRA